MTRFRHSAINLVRPERFELPAPWFVARCSCSAELRTQNSGGSGRIRTDNPLLARQVLSQLELLTH